MVGQRRYRRIYIPVTDESERWLDSISRHMGRKYGWDADELWSMASLAYVRGVRRWDGRGSMTGYVRRFVIRELLHPIKVAAVRRRLLPRNPAADPEWLPAPPRFDLDGFLRDLPG